jgi:acetyltransferase-like isoleucine patch superfamily enzyme
MDTAASAYNLVYNNRCWRFRFSNHFSIRGAFLKGVKYRISGKGNEIIIGRKARLTDCSFTFIGNYCKVIIGGGSTIISNVNFWCQDDNSSIVIGNDFTMGKGHIAATEGESITIGNDCMFSDDIEIRNGDSHSIINTQTKRRTNQAAPVKIGDHVWLTAHTRVLKGSIIPSHSIIGNSSIVAGKLEKENALYSGIPCKLIKENTDWDRYKL